MYNSFGFPADLTEMVAKERGWTIDQAGFEELLTLQRERSRESWKGSGDYFLPPQVRSWTVTPTFVGYTTTEVENAKILAVTEPLSDGTDLLL